RTSHSQAWSPPYDRGRHPSPRPCTCPRRSWPFLDRCHSAVGDAAGPGGAPAAKRGRTTWRRGKTTATLGREEGQRATTAADATAPEAHLTRPEKDRPNSLTQRGFVLDAGGYSPRDMGGSSILGLLRAGGVQIGPGPGTAVILVRFVSTPVAGSRCRSDARCGTSSSAGTGRLAADWVLSCRHKRFGRRRRWSGGLRSSRAGG